MFIQKVTLSDITNNANFISFNIIMKLEDETNFLISFGNE